MRRWRSSRLWQPKGSTTPDGVYLAPIAGGDDYPALLGSQNAATEGESEADSGGTTVIAGSSASTKGSFTEIVASTPFDAEGILVHIFDPFSDAHVWDIAVGEASEQVIISDLMSYGNYGGRHPWFFPLFIPEGTRITARVQSAPQAFRQSDCAVTLFEAPPFLPSSPLSVATGYGVELANSRGTLIDPGGLANTKGAWVELSASVNEIRQLTLATGNNANFVLSTAQWLLDIGIGPATEQLIVENLLYKTDSIKDLITPLVVTLPISIPEGERLAVRTQCNITDATDRVFDLVAYGVE